MSMCQNSYAQESFLSMQNTSTDVVLVDRREACITMKQRRLSAKAKLRTASMYTICKKHGNYENAEQMYKNVKVDTSSTLPNDTKMTARSPGLEE